MADRKKAKKAAIDFSVETSTPKPPTTKKPRIKKAPVATASEVLPGLRKAQREKAVRPHSRAISDKRKRQVELADAVEEARMPAQKLAEQTASSDRHIPDRAGFPAREKARKAKETAEENERKAFAAKRYKEAPVSEDEVARADAIRRTRGLTVRKPKGY